MCTPTHLLVYCCSSHSPHSHHLHWHTCLSALHHSLHGRVGGLVQTHLHTPIHPHALVIDVGCVDAAPVVGVVVGVVGCDVWMMILSCPHSLQALRCHNLSPAPSMPAPTYLCASLMSFSHALHPHSPPPPPPPRYLSTHPYVPNPTHPYPHPLTKHTMCPNKEG